MGNCGHGNLQANRRWTSWTCDVCGKVIEGTANTIHLGVISHVRSEARRGERKPNRGHYGSEEDLAWIAGGSKHRRGGG